MKVVLFGAGGHGKVAMDCCRSIYPSADIVVGDDGAGIQDTEFCGCRVIGGRATVTADFRGWSCHVAIGANRMRGALFELFRLAGLVPLTLTHQSAIVSASAEIGAGTLVMPRVVVNAGALIGEDCILNTGAIIEHDCVIGDHVHISPGAVLGGGVRVGSYAHVGLGAVILPGAVIGEDAVVGAGAVVLKRVEAGAKVVGVPAREL